MAGNIGAKSCANMHKNGSASANYYIGTDGTICSGVAENRRAWTSSSGANDHKAITYEVANNAGEPNWTISAAAYKSMIALSRDICSRYGISPHFDGSASGSLTAHYMFASTACPGPYIKGKLKDGTIENDIKNGISSGNNTTQNQQSQNQQSQKTQTQNQTSEQTYVVKSGDTLGGIAAKFNVSGGYMTLANYNHISNPNVISVGQVIKIPGSKTAASSNSTTAKTSETQTSTSAQTKKEENKAAADITYVVKSGDTLGAIATKFGVSGGYQRLATYNGIANPNCISVGQVIKIPSSSSAVTAGGTQTAQVSGGSVKGDAKLASTAAQVAAEMNSTGWCATGVSRAISRRYNIWLSGNGNQMDDSMIANGNFVQLNLSLAEALKIPGLILTWEATATKLGSIYGHTAITEGNGYASYSDFRESNTLGCSGRTGYKCFVHKNYV